jgi:hypothetical protein
MKIKTTHSSLTANDWKVFSQRAEASEGGFPFVITSSGTPHIPTRWNRKLLVRK